MYVKNVLYIVLVRLRVMRNNYDINPKLMDGDRYDFAIMGNLMYEDLTGNIKDSGKAGDKRIYETLKWMENEFKIKL